HAVKNGVGISVIPRSHRDEPQHREEILIEQDRQRSVNALLPAARQASVEHQHGHDVAREAMGAVVPALEDVKALFSCAIVEGLNHAGDRHGSAAHRQAVGPHRGPKARQCDGGIGLARKLGERFGARVAVEEALELRAGLSDWDSVLPLGGVGGHSPLWMRRPEYTSGTPMRDACATIESLEGTGGGRYLPPRSSSRASDGNSTPRG